MKNSKEIAIDIFLMQEYKKVIDITSLCQHSDYTLDEVDQMLNDASDSWEMYQNRIDAFNDELLH